jgi:hypothetical protein
VTPVIFRIVVVSTTLVLLLPGVPKAAPDMAAPQATSFAYSRSHTARPLPADAVKAIREANSKAESMRLPDKPVAPAGLGAGAAPVPTRRALCSTAASVAEANRLPVPFFANLIWQESGFNSKVVSPAGAQGIAQFMPGTAIEHGLINPFDPVHAMSAAGRFLRSLLDQFGNPGLAAAAYNAGPRRVSDWMAKRGRLPDETRRYVLRITGQPAEQWAQGRGDAVVMPAKAPCVEVARVVLAEAKARADALAQARKLAERSDRKARDGGKVAMAARQTDGSAGHARSAKQRSSRVANSDRDKASKSDRNVRAEKHDRARHHGGGRRTKVADSR